MGKYDDKWKTLIDAENLLPNLVNGTPFRLKADTIRKYKEPRLMASMNTVNDVPKVLKEHGFSIVSLSRQEYLLGKFNLFKKIKDTSAEDYENVLLLSKPAIIEAIDEQNITSEAVLLSLCQSAGMFHSLFEEEELLPSISGRMTTGQFKFYFQNNAGRVDVQVSNTQCEIDASFESANKLYLIEAKNNIPQNFNIRQLYYPFRKWAASLQKEIVPVFVYTNGDIIGADVYAFEDPYNYNSLQLIKRQLFTFSEVELTMGWLLESLRSVNFVPEPTDVPFPQANSVERMIDLSKFLIEPRTKLEVADEYNFDQRQSEYYFNALRYLSLAEKESGHYKLTTLGEQFAKKPAKEKNKLLIEQIIRHRPLHDLLQETLKKHDLLEQKQAEQILANHQLNGVNPKKSTLKRRAHCVNSWVAWIIKQIEA